MELSRTEWNLRVRMPQRQRQPLGRVLRARIAASARALGRLLAHGPLPSTPLSAGWHERTVGDCTGKFQSESACAATAVLFSFKSAGRQRRFFANRPFYFMIYDFQNDLPMFMGKFSNPADVNLSTRQKLKTNVKFYLPCRILISG